MIKKPYEGGEVEGKEAFADADRGGDVSILLYKVMICVRGSENQKPRRMILVVCTSVKLPNPTTRAESLVFQEVSVLYTFLGP